MKGDGFPSFGVAGDQYWALLDAAGVSDWFEGEGTEEMVLFPNREIRSLTDGKAEGAASSALSFSGLEESPPFPPEEATLFSGILSPGLTIFFDL